jgi:hypothetical protein
MFATYMKAQQDGRIVSIAVTVAVGSLPRAQSKGQCRRPA